ncbi:MAG: SCO family protein [Brevundimonas sp.]|uniref:SCO family protein n=1 Tax=Brevundimonas sp. TaxID=1871086 RepID=UPI0025C5280E|nr:SCO family protein [Brevundimonas sp.]MBX3477971.1 SCO family protein [Brevundimonas sp.]
MPRRPILLFAAACVALAAVIAVAAIAVSGRRAPDAGAVQVSEQGQPLIGGDFTMVDQDGRAVDQTMLNGKWSLVFFGFTYCPDYCPTTLAMLDATQKQLGPDGPPLQVVFVSVDPERDTPQALKDYLSSDGFPRGVIGLTGTPDQVRDIAGAYRASYARVGEGEAYTMQHSLTIYLMGPDGRFRTALAHDLGPERAAEVIRRAVARG